MNHLTVMRYYLYGFIVIARLKFRLKLLQNVMTQVKLRIFYKKPRTSWMYRL